MRDILIVVEGRIATVELVEQVFAHAAKHRALTWRTRIDSDVSVDDFGADTIPLFVRTSNPFAARFARALHNAGVPYAFYLDDNFWDFGSDTEIGRVYSKRGPRRRLDGIVRDAELVITSTDTLLGLVTPMNAKVTQLDVAIDFSLYPQEPPTRTDGSADRVRMGFAGSTNRSRDFAELMAVVLDALDAHPQLELEVIGPRSAVPSHPRITVFPYLHSHAAYVTFQTQRAWDIGLAPLTVTASNQYKTDVKYREYAAQYIAGIYQDAAPYSRVVDGVTGLLASTPEQWRAAIDRLVTDRDLRESVRLAARADAEQRYAPGPVADRWLRALEVSEVVRAPRTPQQTEDVRAFLAQPVPWTVRTGWRLRLLVAYGRTMVEQHGWAHTIGRAVRFARKKVLGR